MNPIERSIAIARRRICWNRFLRWMGRFLVWGLLACATLLLADRLMALRVSTAAYPMLVVLTVPAAAMVAWWHRPSREQTASWIDHRLNLQDRLGSALYAASLPEHPFTQRVIRDAEHVADNLPLSSAFPVRLSRVWFYVGPSATLVVLTVTFVPRLDLVGLERSRTGQQTQREQASDARKQVEGTVDAIKRVAVSENPTQAGMTELDLQEWLEELSELTRRDLADAQQRRRAAGKLTQLNEHLSDQVRQQESILQSVQSETSQLDTQNPGPADPLTQALRRGDYEAAQEIADAFLDNVQQMSHQQRQALGQQLDELSHQLQEVPQQQAPPQDKLHEDDQNMSKDRPQDMSHNESDQQPPVSQDNRPSDRLPQAVDSPETQRDAVGPQAQQHTPQPTDSQPPQDDNRRIREYCRDLSRSLKKLSRSIQNREQTKQPQPTPSQHPADQDRQGLTRLVEAHRKLQRLRQAQEQTHQAIDRLGHHQESKGLMATTGHDETDPPKTTPAVGPYRMKTQAPPGADGGVAMTVSRVSGDSNAKKTPTTGFDGIGYDDARQRAEKALTQDRIPSRYHEAIRQYFDRMPPSPDTRAAPDPPPR